MNEQHLNRVRTSWAAIGAAVAITLGAGGIGIVNADDTEPPIDVAGEDVNLGDLPILRPTNPCRLADTRGGFFQTGVRSTPLGAGQSQVHDVHGSNGDCPNVPTDVVAIVANVTAVNPSADTYLSLAPGGSPSPDTSNLNVVAGQAPTPNAVVVGLQNGRFNIYNAHGNTDYIVDIVGLFRNHNHDLSYLSMNSYNALKPVAEYGNTTTGVGNIGAAAVSVMSTAITASAPGTIVASANTTIAFGAVGQEAQCALNTAAAMDNATSQIIPYSSTSDQMSVTRHITVPAGTHTVHLVCLRVAGAGTLTAQRPQISLLFVAD